MEAKAREQNLFLTNRSKRGGDGWQRTALRLQMARIILLDFLAPDSGVGSIEFGMKKKCWVMFSEMSWV